MNLKNLLDYDSNLNIVDDKYSLNLETISTVEEITPNSLIFLGTKKIVKSFFEQDKKSNLALVVDQKLLDEFKEDLSSLKEVNIATTSNLKLSMCQISKVFYDRKFLGVEDVLDGRKAGNAEIHPSSHISEGVFIGENVKIAADVRVMPGATILSHCSIGEGTTIYPNVSIMPFTNIGKLCRIHSGTTIGSDGFGYHYENGVHHKIWHFGGVNIKDYVEIGSNCSIDQGTFTPTLIESGAKIDNLVQIAHNVKIGPGVILCGQVGLAGSSEVGAFTVMGGKAALADGKSIGQGGQIAGAAMVLNDLEPGAKVGGHPARPLGEWLRGVAFLRKSSTKKSKES